MLRSQEEKRSKQLYANGRMAGSLLTVDEDNHFTIDDINNALATYYNKELSAYTKSVTNEQEYHSSVQEKWTYARNNSDVPRML